MDELTHTVTVTVTGRYPHGERQHAEVTVSGRGDLAHMIGTFQAALMAAGFTAETASCLTIEECL